VYSLGVHHPEFGKTYRRYAKEAKLKLFVWRNEVKCFAYGICLFGQIAHFPSISNSHKAVFDKRASKGKVISSRKAKARLQVVTDLYHQEALSNSHYRISFGSEKVIAIVHLARKRGRWDSHNQPKAIGDWLENIGLIDDDKHLTIWAYKQSEFYGATDPRAAYTTIMLYPMESVLSRVREATEEIHREALHQFSVASSEPPEA
jgi:hypothetical protein